MGMMADVSAATPVAAVQYANLPAYSRVYDPARDPFTDGRAAIKNAKATKRRILIEVGGNWCSWCHRLDRFIRTNKDIERKLHETFVILKVNISDKNDNHEFMSSLAKPLGYPHMYIAESDGRVVYSQDTAEFLYQGKYSKQYFLDFLEKWKQ